MLKNKYRRPYLKGEQVYSIQTHVLKIEESQHIIFLHKIGPIMKGTGKQNPEKQVTRYILEGNGFISSGF